jgi:hypothetical protein
MALVSGPGGSGGPRRARPDAKPSCLGSGNHRDCLTHASRSAGSGGPRRARPDGTPSCLGSGDHRDCPTGGGRSAGGGSPRRARPDPNASYFGSGDHPDCLTGERYTVRIPVAGLEPPVHRRAPASEVDAWIKSAAVRFNSSSTKSGHSRHGMSRWKSACRPGLGRGMDSHHSLRHVLSIAATGKQKINSSSSQHDIEAEKGLHLPAPGRSFERTCPAMTDWVDHDHEPRAGP